MYPELFRSKKIILGVLVFLIFTLVILGPRYRREQHLEHELVLTPAPSVSIVEKEQLRLTTPTLSAVKETEQRSSPTPTITIQTEQQSSQSSTVSTVKEQQLRSPSPTISIAEINQYFKTHPRKDGSFIKKLSQPQIQHVITQMRIGNITSENGQKQFIQCAGKMMLHNLPIHIPKSDQHCKKMSFQSSGSVIALASFPGSGNSWVRQLLESATGIYTGALYCDPAYVRAGMIGEGVSTQNVIAIKTHEIPAKAKKRLNHDKAIYIVRSPFAAILAFYNWQRTSQKSRHTLEIDPSYHSYGMKATVYWEIFKDGLFCE